MSSQTCILTVRSLSLQAHTEGCRCYRQEQGTDRSRDVFTLSPVGHAGRRPSHRGTLSAAWDACGRVKNMAPPTWQEDV